MFQLPPLYMLGNAPRTIGSVRTPRSFNTNLSLGKEFSLARVREGMNLELHLETYNAFNHPVFGTPDTEVDDPNFGIITYTSNGPRQVQFGVKLTSRRG